jgi:phage tail sheath protein FI
LRNAIKIAYNPNQAQRDELYGKRVNPIVSFPGQGIVLYGDKTALRSPSAFDRINVRRLFLILERTIKDFSKSVLFELNDTTTRNNFATQVNNYMRDIQARRGMTDFLVVADESNNTADVIDRNEFVADIYIKPSRSINFITLTFVATRTGVSFDEVVGRV